MQALIRNPRILAALLALAALHCHAGAADHGAPAPGRPEVLPRPDHVVIVIEENQAYGRIIGSPLAPYINRLANEGARFTNSYAVTHPSEPNYLVLFAGSTYGVPDDRCPIQLSGDNLASALARRSLSFAIYSESLPAAGFDGCASPGNYYARKHNPAVNWQGSNVAPQSNLPFDRFPEDFSKLPTVAMVVPNQVNDMHDGPSPEAAISQGDAWLKTHIEPYARWAMTHNSLLIVTWDEDDGTAGNRIPTIFVGPMVKRGSYGTRIDHYGVLRSIADMYRLQAPGQAAASAPIEGVWIAPDPPAHR
jgi:acid phosphatase